VVRLRHKALAEFAPTVKGGEEGPASLQALHHMLNSKSIQDRQHTLDHRGARRKLSHAEVPNKLMEQWIVKLRKRNVRVQEPNKAE
jgi:hypothetical protein